MPHPSSNSFQCPTCSKAYSRPESLSRHLHTHNVRKRHTCNACGKGFTRSDLLSRHEKTHSGPRHSRTISKNRSGSGRRETRNTTLSLPRNSNLGDLEDGADNSIGPLAARSSIETSNRLDSRLPNTIPSMLTMNVHSSMPDPLENGGIPLDPIAVESPDMQFNLLGDQDVLLQDWFDQNFYDALHETDTFWPPNGGIGGLDMFTGTDMLIPEISSLPTTGNIGDNEGSVLVNSPIPVSRIPSPPNEASAEDSWPFTWDPRSRRILAARAIVITDDDPIQLEHRPRFDLTETKYDKVKRFWQVPGNHGTGTLSVEMPTLRTANILIGLFFSHFEPRMPVIHRPSLPHTDDLPDALIAAMIVIGAIYSRQRHSTRFAIMLLDMTRIAAQVNMEHDNSLMRDTMYIYAVALICFVGLWCGNKRAFELAELSRAAVVNFCRRSHFAGTSPSQQHRDATGDRASGVTDIGVQWTKWIDRETKKRLCWVVYGIDCQAASLLHIPPTLSISEICKLECPCDEEFWHASSARRWKRLLGVAPFPASRALSSALAPFLRILYAKTNAERHKNSRRAADRTLTVLNAWSRLLVLQALELSIYTLSEDIAVTTAADLTDSDSEEDDSGAAAGATSRSRQAPFDTVGLHRSTESSTKQALTNRKTRLEAMLRSWSHTCLTNPPPDTTLYATSKCFYEAATRHYNLAVLSLNVQIVDLQDSLGKSGATEMAVALERLSNIYESDVAQTTATVLHCKKLAEIDTGNNKCTTGTPTTACAGRERESDSHPEVFIGLFLSYVYMWTVAMTANAGLKTHILTAMASTPETAHSKISSVLQYALSVEDDNPQAINTTRSVARPTVILRSGAEALSRLRPWGACLNLALLLHQRAKM